MNLYVAYQYDREHYSRLVWGHDIDDAAARLARGQAPSGIPDGFKKNEPVIFAKVSSLTTKHFRLLNPNRYDFVQWKN